MVARKFFVLHEDSSFNVDHDTEDGLEVLRFKIFSLTKVPPDDQKIVAEDDDDRLVSDESDLASISDKLRLLSTQGNSEKKSEAASGSWDKTLDYVIAISKDMFYDIAKRYTKKWHEVMDSLHDASSGEEEWRRSEFGSDEKSSSSSTSCPIRTCHDDHVTNIYDSFLPILTLFVEDGLSVERATEVLKMIKRVLVDLNNASYKMRKTHLNLNGSSSFPEQFLPAMGGLLLALSLKIEDDTNNKTVTICLDGNTKKTALALPVALDALKELVTNLSKCQNLNKDSLSFPLVKQNRICSGSILASGEELPFGIATAAFDGIRETKWEEPNGAKGCWIMFKTLNNKKLVLIAYELMSANDAPEKDPEDWILEGSNDGGSTWHFIDKQTGQVFEDRCQRKSYELASPSWPLKLFRFRFLWVRDMNSTSQLQLGSIDLYGSYYKRNTLFL